MRQQTNATPSRSKKPPTPTTTPIIMLRFLVERPPLLFLSELSASAEEVEEDDPEVADASSDVAELALVDVESSAVVVKVLVMSTVVINEVGISLVGAEVTSLVDDASSEVVVVESALDCSTVEEGSEDVVDSAADVSEEEAASVVDCDSDEEEASVEISDDVSRVVDGSSDDDDSVEEIESVELIRVVFPASCLATSATNEGAAVLVATKLGSSCSK